MAYIYHGTNEWIKQPNRLVKTFSSGLCLIQQDYVRRKKSVTYFDFNEGDRLLDEDADPCMDGAYIFPAPSYQDTEDGFIKCTVTAYGRVNTTGVINTNLSQGLILNEIVKARKNNTAFVMVEYATPRLEPRSITYSDVATALNGAGFIETITKKFVITDGESLLGNIDGIPKAFNESGQIVKYPITASFTGEAGIYNYDPSINDPDAIVTVTTTEVEFGGRITLNFALKNYQSTSFGFFTEITATYSPVFNFFQTF
jgi:hypothetical protein